MNQCWPSSLTHICGTGGRWVHGPFTRYVTLQVELVPGISGTFSPHPRFGDPDMHHGTCVTHVSWCISGSLISGFLLNQWRGKRSRHSRRMRKPQFYVSGKRPMVESAWIILSFMFLPSGITHANTSKNYIIWLLTTTWCIRDDTHHSYNNPYRSFKSIQIF